MAYLTYNGKYVTHNGKMVVSSGGSVPDSVSISPPYDLEFYGDGTPSMTDTVTITSSGTWTRSLIDTGDGTGWVLSAYPSSGGNGDTCTLYLEGGYEGVGRQCTLRFTVGTATAEVDIIQWGWM